MCCQEYRLTSSMMKIKFQIILFLWQLVRFLFQILENTTTKTVLYELQKRHEMVLYSIKMFYSFFLNHHAKMWYSMLSFQHFFIHMVVKWWGPLECVLLFTLSQTYCMSHSHHHHEVFMSTGDVTRVKFPENYDQFIYLAQRKLSSQCKTAV